MAVGWMTLLKAVPWTDVLAKAPEVASSASKLWNTVSRKQAVDDDASTQAGDAVQENPLVVLTERVERNELSVTDLRIQITQCSELLAQMAEQNSLLVAKIDAERRKAALVAVTACVSLALAAASLLMRAGNVL